MPDNVLKMGGFKDASDALRLMEDGLKEELQEGILQMSEVPILGETRFHTMTRVSK
jgi:hypothetical protein